MKCSTKDCIVNLRVSKETYEKIKERAKRDGDTASSLIRSLIQDSIDTVADLSSEFLSEEDKPDAEIVSYHKGVLAQGRVCKNCDHEMKEGDAVTIGETSTGRRSYFCLDCKSGV